MKDNKLIANFMEYKSYEQNGYTIFKYPNNQHLTEMDLRYHDDWNWLMPVVRKITTDESSLYVGETVRYGIIEYTYQSVVEFIKEQVNKV